MDGWKNAGSQNAGTGITSFTPKTSQGKKIGGTLACYSVKNQSSANGKQKKNFAKLLRTSPRVFRAATESHSRGSRVSGSCLCESRNGHRQPARQICTTSNVTFCPRWVRLHSPK